MNETSTIMYTALKSHFEAERNKAIATLQVYFTNPAGIGEHPQIMDEMINQVKLLEEANGCLETLNKTFVTSEKTESNDNK